MAVLVSNGISAQGITVAQDIFNCDSLFSTGSATLGGQSLVSASGVLVPSNSASNGAYIGMLDIAIVLVLMMFAILGVVYAIGSAFGINKLIDFVKRESVESLANIIIIVVIFVGGFAVFNNAIIFFANLAAAGVGSAPATITSSGAPLSTSQVFTQTCWNYENSIINGNLINYFNVVELLFLVHIILNLQVNLNPNGFGFIIQPYAGVQTLQTTVWSEEAISFGIIGIGALLILLLFVVYWLFPIFFYAGIVLRSFPWTRAAGGSMLALFISFYIIFPALLYTFSAFSTGNAAICGSGSQAATLKLCTAGSDIGKLLLQEHVTLSTVSDAAGSVFGASSFGTAMYDNVTDFTNEVSSSILQMAGVLLSLIIAYDLLEFLGDVLGSPSLQSNRILSKVL